MELSDFNPLDTGPEQPILALLQARRDASPRTACGREQFLALLAGVPALRKTPGLPGPGEMGGDYFTTLPRCGSPLDEAACRAHLKGVFGITDKDSLLEFCDREILCHSQYLDFEGFWENRPPFDLSQLEEGPREFFQSARDFSAQFYPVTGHRGYLAWDISECTGHLRAGLACGLLTREEFDQLAEHWIVQAQIFRSWAEYAASLVCGALYWDFRQGARLPQLQKSQEMWLKLVSLLLDDGGAWGSGLWYAPPRKKPYKLWPPEFRLYLPHWHEPNGCFATDHITVLGKKVGWCYREEPDGQFPDSGWRFFSGEESDDYVNDLEHTGVYDLNSICNCDPEILPLLSAPFGTAYARGADGKFHAEQYAPSKDRKEHAT